MRKPLPSISRLVLLVVPVAALIAQTDHTNAFTGTWKLNVAKSKFSRNGPTQRDGHSGS